MSVSDNIGYEEHLFDDTTDGYVHIAKFKNKKIVKIYNIGLKGLREVIEEVEGEEDTYITPNTFFIPKRMVRNVRQFRALYLDIDKIEDSQLQVAYSVFEMAERGEIPKPSMVINSGKGIHLYWKIKNAPYQALYTWQQLQDFLYYKLKCLGADPKALDAARILRIPGTINSKNNKECRVIYIDEDLEYSMYDLREKYLEYKPKSKQLEFQQAKKKTNSKVINNKFFNSYSLHMARAEDIETLCKLRNYDLHEYKCRNMAVHCYAYWRGLVVRNDEELEKEVIEFNNALTKPLRESEIKAILRCIPKVIDKFINYENEIKEGKDRRVSKGMRDKEGYWYKNETLIERLHITPEEQKHLKTIISRQEKYRRNNEKRTPRNDNGLTSREQQKLDTIKKVQELKAKGLNNTQIAKEIGKSVRYVRQIINS